MLSEYAAQKEEITNSIKANYEKVLHTERTLKTQVSMHLFWGGLGGAHESHEVSFRLW